MGRKKIILISISLFLVVLVLVITVLLYGNFIKEQKYGNTEGNIVNSLSHVTSDEKFTYIALYTGIYRGTDISSLRKIADGDYSDLNYMEGKLFAYNIESDEIISMKIDGTEKEVLYKGNILGPWVVNNNIFFKDIEKSSYFKMKMNGSSFLIKIKPKWGAEEQWVYTELKDRDYEYDLLKRGCNIEESQHADGAVYVIEQLDDKTPPNRELYRYEYGADEGVLLAEDIFRFNISEDKIYYLASGENKSELCVMRMGLDGRQKEEITKILLDEPVNAAGVGVGQEILCLSIALEPDLNHVLFLVDIETGEYVQVMKDDTFVSPE